LDSSHTHLTNNSEFNTYLTRQKQDLTLLHPVSPAPKNENPPESTPVCIICQRDLDVEHPILSNDNVIKLKKVPLVISRLEDYPELGRRRILIDCGNKHEFCYECILSYYLKLGNKCPLCRQRFHHIANRQLKDREASLPMTTRTVARVNYDERTP